MNAAQNFCFVLNFHVSLTTECTSHATWRHPEDSRCSVNQNICLDKAFLLELSWRSEDIHCRSLTGRTAKPEAAGNLKLFLFSTQLSWLAASMITKPGPKTDQVTHSAAEDVKIEEENQK
ncbi:hypothetical protein RvY_07398-1 [Ramazzottius varieornatus]|uniref:Uncharacterized protein n=1 Tax=Ramazzottius varieornatus TaxID=947166 RepID=A0A1D1V848_RAMVA|nr:hypothetical protein RvY_07398-1 [Ramazzottius varieornatus]